MKTLQELFDTLAAGEFSNIAIGQSTLASITEESYPKIVSYINLGLTELYKRFVLQMREIKVHQHSSVTTYYLNSDHTADAASMDAEYYIEVGDDSTFDGRIVRILEAYDADGKPVFINNPNFPKDIFMLGTHQLKWVPPDSGIPCRTATIVYQAYHSKITVTETFDPESVTLEYPDFIENALLNFIASRLFKGKVSKATEGAQQPHSTFQYQFEKECLEIKNLGLALTGDEQYSSTRRFEEKGWC